MTDVASKLDYTKVALFFFLYTETPNPDIKVQFLYLMLLDDHDMV